MQVSISPSGSKYPFPSEESKLYLTPPGIRLFTKPMHKRNEARLRFALMHEATHRLLHQRAFSAENSFFSNEKYDNQCLPANEDRIDYSRKQQERTDGERLELPS